MIRGYDRGANITLLNVIYHKPKKNEETGKYDDGSLDIIYKDMNTKEKKLQHIDNPDYTYYIAKDEYAPDYNKLFIEKDKVYPVTCKYKDIKKDIAERTNNLDWFYDNLRNGNARENEKLFTIPKIFGADMHIEDYYRFLFDDMYENTPFIPDKLYFDIEVDGINQAGDFPEMGECPVNACTLVHDGTKHVYVLLLENPENPLIEEFKKQPDLTKKLKSFVQDKVGGWKQEIRYGLNEYEYTIAFFNEEIQLIHTIFNIINTLKPDFAMAWNIAFDLPYLIERIKTLGYLPEDIICHKDFEVKEAWYYVDQRADKFEERGDYAQISSYTIFIDQLITFASRRKGQRQLPGFKLDFIGDIIAGVRKLDYSYITTVISELPYKNYLVFAFYNVMDVIVQKCIEHKVGDIDFLYNKAMMNNTRFAKVHRQTTYLVNRGVKEFNKMGLVMGCNANKSNQKVGFPGAYVADPKNLSDKPKYKINNKSIMVCPNLDDFDYKALYPSIIDENNMSADTMDGKILLPDQIDPKENRFNNDYFDRTVWMIEDYVSGNRLDFCSRYFNMGTYEEVYDDINEYFSTIKNPMRCLRYTDPINGMIFACRKIATNENRIAIIRRDESKKYIIPILDQERMPNNENNNN